MKACKENAFLDREQKSASGECPNAGFDTAEIYRRLIRRDIHLDLGMQVKPEHKRIGDFRRTPRLYEIEVILSAQPVACFAQRQAARMIDTEKPWMEPNLRRLLKRTTNEAKRLLSD